MFEALIVFAIAYIIADLCDPPSGSSKPSSSRKESITHFKSSDLYTDLISIKPEDYIENFILKSCKPSYLEEPFKPISEVELPDLSKSFFEEYKTLLKSPSRFVYFDSLEPNIPKIDTSDLLKGIHPEREPLISLHNMNSFQDTSSLISSFLDKERFNLNQDYQSENKALKRKSRPIPHHDD